MPDSSRRLHRRWGGPPPLAGGSDPGLESGQLRDIVRGRLSDGRLPMIDNRVVASPLSTGRPCAVCDEPVSAPDPEYQPEGQDGGPLVAHWPCYAVWLLESVVRPPDVAI